MKNLFFLILAAFTIIGCTSSSKQTAELEYEISQGTTKGYYVLLNLDTDFYTNVEFSSKDQKLPYTYHRPGDTVVVIRSYSAIGDTYSLSSRIAGPNSDKVIPKNSNFITIADSSESHVNIQEIYRAKIVKYVWQQSENTRS
jgi:hypothetical protein